MSAPALADLAADAAAIVARLLARRLGAGALPEALAEEVAREAAGFLARRAAGEPLASVLADLARADFVDLGAVRSRVLDEG